MEKEEEKVIVRICGVDLDGNLPIERGLWRIKGVGFSFAHAVRRALGYPPEKKLKELSEDEIKKVEDCIRNPQKYGIPSWLFNRRKDYETGVDMHLTGGDLDVVTERDIERLKKIECWRGIRHELHYPVRGKKTKPGYTFPPYRKHKRGMVVGVGKKKGPGAK